MTKPLTEAEKFAKWGDQTHEERRAAIAAKRKEYKEKAASKKPYEPLPDKAGINRHWLMGKTEGVYLRRCYEAACADKPEKAETWAKALKAYIETRVLYQKNGLGGRQRSNKELNTNPYGPPPVPAVPQSVTPFPPFSEKPDATP